jgi:hypothetical protein
LPLVAVIADIACANENIRDNGDFEPAMLAVSVREGEDIFSVEVDEHEVIRRVSCTL